MAPRVRTHGIYTLLLVPLVSSQRVLQVATTPRSCGQCHSPLASILSHSSSSPRLCRCFGELARSCLSIFGQATPPSAPPASPLHCRHVGCGCRASVSPHCLLRRDLTSLELRRGHRCRGQGSIVYHFFSFLFKSFALSCWCSLGSSFARSPTRDAGGWPHTTAVPSFARSRSLGCGRVRVSGTNRRGVE